MRLERRRVGNDLIESFKIMNGVYDDLFFQLEARLLKVNLELHRPVGGRGAQAPRWSAVGAIEDPGA